MPKKRGSRKISGIYCEPSICDQCIYIGEGDCICDVTHEIVLSDWVPTDNFMEPGCLHHKDHKKKGANAILAIGSMENSEV